MKIKFRRFDVFTLELIGVLSLHIAELAIRFPCNHADHVMFSYGDCLAVIGLFGMVNTVMKREICPAFWLILTASLFIPLLENKCNILLPYETWIERGMPDWGTVYRCEIPLFPILKLFGW